jgi:hypothetical protein
MTPPTIGYPERWAAFNQRHARFVEQCYPSLIRTSEAILNRHVLIGSIADDVIFLLGRAAFEDYCELWILAGNGYGIGALKILRGLYEKVVTLGYLEKHGEEVQKFVDYEVIQRHRLMNRVKRNQFLRDRFTAEDYNKIESEYEAVKDRFLDKNGRSLSWTSLDTFSMAIKAGRDLGTISVSAYVVPNLKVHATVSDLASRKVPQPDGTFKFNNDAQEKDADSALVTGTSVLVTSLFILNDYFQLGMRSEIEQVQIAFALSYPLD